MEKLLIMEKIYNLRKSVVDNNGQEHIVTIFAFVTHKKDRNVPYQFETKDSKCTCLISQKKKMREVKLTYTICHPNDTYNYDIALKIARRRVKENPSAVLMTYDLVTSLKVDQISALMLNEMLKINETIVNE